MAEPSSERIENALAELLDQPLVGIRQQLSERLAEEVRAAEQEAAARAADEATRVTRQATAEALCAAVRRILRTTTITDIGATLLETASAYAGRVALLVHKGESLSGWRVYGAARNGGGDQAAAEALARSWSGLKVTVSQAPALAQAIESREAVVSLSLPDHLSPEVVQLLDLQPEEKVYLFPLSLRQTVVGVVYADNREAAEGIQPAALELLCAVAEAALEAISSRLPLTTRGKEDAGETDRLVLPVSRPAPPPPADWSQMSPADRDQHLRAQRFARVLVADLQLYRAQEIRDAKKARNLYGFLQEEIDKSREAYYRKFGHAATAGVDYFHVELLRTLADNQEALLGPEYPGPLVASLSEP